MKIKIISVEDPLYQQERELRNKILLRPIGVPDFGWEMHDKDSWHFVAIENSKVVGCVVLTPLNEKKSRTQLMQMAVDTPFQGKGIGKALVKKLLKFSSEHSIKEIEIHSRADVVSFYEQFCFKIFGDPFEEVGIAHRYMRIFLT